MFLIRLLPTMCVLIGISPSGAVQAQENKPVGYNKTSSYVKVTATASKLDERGHQVLTVILDIDPRCYLFANPVGNDDLAQFKTNMVVKIEGKPAPVIVIFPSGRPVSNKAAGDYRTYTGKVVIKASVQRAADVAGRLEVEVRMQGSLFRGPY